MAVPIAENIEVPLLKVIKDAGGELQAGEAVARVEKFFPDLKPEDKLQELASGHYRWRNRVQWARQWLIEAGHLDPAAPFGIWRITKKGEERVNEELSSWKPRYSALERLRSAEKKAEAQKIVEEDPHSQIDEAYRRILNVRRKEILLKLHSLEPTSFEKLIKRLLDAIKLGEVKVTGRPKDGGIDGECSLDPFGLQKILFQAKRWTSTVGASDVRDFMGALGHHGFEHGIFVTTSDFTADAKKEAEEAKRVKVRLINGSELANLLIKYRVGVISVKSIDIPEVDD